MFLDAKNRIRAEMIREMRVDIPTPRAPMLKTRMKIALPTTLMMFAMIEVHIVVFVFPWTRSMAFKELWEARKGREMSMGRA